MPEHSVRRCDARRRIVVFPHAGGSASDYSSWASAFDRGTTDVHVVQLPGRGSRFYEAALTDLGAMADTIAWSISEDLPFVLVGHSMGALLAFETYDRLVRLDKRLPDAVVVSAFPAPDAIPDHEALHKLDPSELVELLSRRFGAVPDEVLADKELVALVGAYVRADYEAVETYTYRERDPIGATLAILTAVDDYRPQDAHGWERHGSGRVEHHSFTGGHFYLREPRNLARITEIVDGLFAAPRFHMEGRS